MKSSSKSRLVLSLLTLIFCFLLLLSPSIFAWEVSTITYDSKSFSTSSQGSSIRGIVFKSDGTSMFILSNNARTVFQYTLSTPWDVSTATYASKSLSVSSQDIAPQDIQFNPSGTRMFMVGSVSSKVYEYDLVTPWDISSGSYNSVNFSVSQADNEYGVYFRSDGLKMYISSQGSSTQNGVYQYTLSVAYDVSTASYDNIFFSTYNEDTLMEGVGFTSDGKTMYAIGTNTNRIFQYTLSSAWDVSSASYNSLSTALNQGSSQAITSFAVRPNNTKLYATENNNSRIYQYSIVDSTPTPTPTISNSSTSSTDSSATATPSSCTDNKPGSAPDLFQISTDKTSATVYFAPISGVHTYFIKYGYTPSDDRFGVEMHDVPSDGVASYRINMLELKTPYYFSIRGANGCMPGDWGAALKTKTSLHKRIFYK